jgi:hypothetical protein
MSESQWHFFVWENYLKRGHYEDVTQDNVVNWQA